MAIRSNAILWLGKKDFFASSFFIFIKRIICVAYLTRFAIARFLPNLTKSRCSYSDRPLPENTKQDWD
ncbi:hypothetical protein [Nostoc sp. C117]|uniref:hypothetical protein n=1 Tax=Nostoc sp. C117 TaxID=3349875 RepID=UPI00370D58F7